MEVCVFSLVVLVCSGWVLVVLSGGDVFWGYVGCCVAGILAVGATGVW